MAVGEVINSVASVANNAYLTMQPGAGAEWTIDSIATASVTCTLYMTDGSNDVIMDVTGSWTNLNIRVTNTYYLRVKNTSGGTVYMGFSGWVSK
jgi:hypothetical protein